MAVKLGINISKNGDKLEYEGGYNAYIPVYVRWEPVSGTDEWFLIAYEEGSMQDGFDYEEYEERLRNGEDFEVIAEEIIAELRDSR